MKFFKILKNKFFLVLGALAITSTNALAEITVDPSTGVISGDIDKAPFFAGAAVVITALAAFWAVKRVIGLFGR